VAADGQKKMMRDEMNLRTSVILAAALAVFTALPASAQRGASCVRNDQINNWKAFSDRLLMIEDYRHKKVLLRLIGTCQNLTFKNTIAIKSVGGTGLSCISVGDQVIARNFGTGMGRCSIVGVEPYTPGLEKKYMKPRS
jgi:Family of unknown function (DUF6491)